MVKHTQIICQQIAVSLRFILSLDNNNVQQIWKHHLIPSGVTYDQLILQRD